MFDAHAIGEDRADSSPDRKPRLYLFFSV